MAWLWIGAGFVLLVLGGEALVRGAVALARGWGVPPLVIGLTLVGFGTSMPELVTSVQAALDGAPGIALGNVVGSNIANILLVLGVAACIAPVAVDRVAFRRDGGALAAASILCLAVILGGVVGRIEGAVLVAGLGGFLWLAFRSAGRGAPAAEVYAHEAEALHGAIPAWHAAPYLAGGIALLVLGARWLVAGAVELAEAWDVPDAVIGLTIVAIGTSLPELATSVIAARRGEADVAFGNVVGSNVFNILGILGITALVVPVGVAPSIAGLDIWVMLAATGLLLAVAATGWRVSRREGLVLVALYAGYLGWLAVGIA